MAPIRKSSSSRLKLETTAKPSRRKPKAHGWTRTKKYATFASDSVDTRFYTFDEVLAEKRDGTRYIVRWTGVDEHGQPWPYSEAVAEDLREGEEMRAWKKRRVELGNDAYYDDLNVKLAALTAVSKQTSLLRRSPHSTSNNQNSHSRSVSRHTDATLLTGATPRASPSSSSTSHSEGPTLVPDEMDPNADLEMDMDMDSPLHTDELSDVGSFGGARTPSSHARAIVHPDKLLKPKEEMFDPSVSFLDPTSLAAASGPGSMSHVRLRTSSTFHPTVKNEDFDDAVPLIIKSEDEDTEDDEDDDDALRYPDSDSDSSYSNA